MPNAVVVAADADGVIDEGAAGPRAVGGDDAAGRVFDRTVALDGVPDGYRAMADREALEVLVTP